MTTPTPGQAYALAQVAKTRPAYEAARAAAVDPTTQGAYDWARQQLADWGLGTMADVILDQVKLGTDPNTALLEIRKTQAYKDRFAGNDLLRANNQPVLSETDYLKKEDALRAQLSDPRYGLPKNFYDTPDDFAKIIGTGMGAGEIQTRLNAVKAVISDGTMNGVLDYAQQHYGLGTGDLMAYYLDPDKAGPMIQRQLDAAPIGAAAARTGFGDITTAEAERLASLGINPGQAAAGFADAAALGEIGKDVGADQGVSRADVLAAEFDQNADARKKIDQTRARRLAEFQGGGGYASSKAGVSGLGTANT